MGETRTIRQAMAELVANATLTEVTNLYRVLFRAFMSFLMIFGGGAFLWVAAFKDEQSLNTNSAIIIGFVVGTFLAVPIGYYFGGQDRLKKDDTTGEIKS